MFTNNVGPEKKFNERGGMNHFPGNTIVSNLYNNPMVMEAIRQIQAAYRNLPWADKYHFMPEGSIHMTVFELLCHYNRNLDSWSKDLSLTDPIEKTDIFFYQQLKHVDIMDCFEMKPLSIKGTNLAVSPNDENTGVMLQDFRNKLTEVTGVSFPNHDSYEFHISFGYKLQELLPEEQVIVDQLNEKLYNDVVSKMDCVDIKKVDYTVFEDMSEFVPYSEQARNELKLRKYPTSY
ncbi:hypothetical protein J2T13_004355 [Paenibacillus sp. DS2015]|uniref:DUF1868 domain-containing protein n=1 Tax=Paenibacillus sp. DS2015 TaxID=3373917 RepID=UPI003D256A33